MSEELEAARCAIQHQEKTIATLRKRMEELTDYENGFIKLQKMAFRIQQRAEKAEAKVSDLEGVVAVFHEAGNMEHEPNISGECNLDECPACVLYRKALADTAKTAREHDARVRAGVWQKILDKANKLFCDKSYWTELSEWIEAKATEARTEAGEERHSDATEKGEG